jgi:hypothetical protein
VLASFFLNVCGLACKKVIMSSSGSSHWNSGVMLLWRVLMIWLVRDLVRSLVLTDVVGLYWSNERGRAISITRVNGRIPCQRVGYEGVLRAAIDRHEKTSQAK